MNYTELCTAIQDYSENTFEATDLANFVQLAEQRLYNLVQTPALRKNVTGTTTSSNKYLACPTDLLSVFSMAVIAPVTGAYTFLLNKDTNFIREAYPAPTDTGTPAYYAFFGPRSDDPKELTFILGPTPDAAYTVELHYNYYPESIVTASTSWLGDNYDSALLNAALMEAITFMKGEADMVQLYKDRMVESIAGFKNLSDGKQRQDTYRSGQTRTGVI